MCRCDDYPAVVTDVRVRLAGPLGLSADGRAADTARLSRHDSLALAYLVVERSRRVGRSELAEVLWDERVPASWQALLRGSMSRLRAMLGDAAMPGALVTGRGWYQLTMPGGTQVDIEVAAAVAREAEALLRSVARDGAPAGAAAVARARALAEAAHDVARQPFLAGVNGAWVGLRQQLLDDLRLHCLELSARAAIQSGEWTDARQQARLAMSRAPLRESVYRLLALAHCGAGDRGEALRVLAACRQVLAEELGADPSPETDELNTGLLRGRPVADLLAAVLSPLAPPARPTVTWPPALRRMAEVGPFVGRGADCDQLRDAWKRAAEGTPQVALVVGEAGAGKSRLLAEFAATVAADGRTILFGQCDGVGGAVLEALGDHLPEQARSAPHASGQAEAVRSTLCRLARTGPVLLVLEDLHELDRDGIALLRYVLRCPDPLPLLLAGSVRTGDPAASMRFEALLNSWQSVAAVARVELTGLGEGHLADLVRLRAGWPPTEGLLSTIAAATGGNPFFVGS
jgi:DNA-binding SARP family transcriptional activator